MRIVRVIVIQSEDVERMRSGETIELAHDLILSMEGVRKRRQQVAQPVSALPAPESKEEERRRKKREYMQKWHARNPHYDRNRRKAVVK